MKKINQPALVFALFSSVAFADVAVDPPSDAVSTDSRYESSLKAPRNIITKRTAEKFALNSAPGVVENDQLELHGGRWIYNMDITGLGQSRNNVWIDARTGQVVKNEVQSAGIVQIEPVQKTTTEIALAPAPRLRDEIVAIAPEIGTVAFTAPNGNYSAKAAYGVGIGVNLAPSLDPYLGVSTGAIFSHMGSTTSGFFGGSAQAGDPSTGSANLLIIPADVKLGYNFSNDMRLSAHGGGNLTYRNVANSVNFGSASSSGSTSVWRPYPNAGADYEWEVAKDVALLVRPDFTFTTGNTLFMGTVGISAQIH